MKSIPVARPDLGRAEADAAAGVILSGWVTQGQRVEEFEAAFARQWAQGMPAPCPTAPRPCTMP